MKRDVSFAKQMKYERERLGWSQGNVAMKIGCSMKTVGRWESGKSVPNTYYRQKISEIFGKDLEEFNLVSEPAGDAGTSFAVPEASQQPLLSDVAYLENSSLPRNQIGAAAVASSLPVA